MGSILGSLISLGQLLLVPLWYEIELVEQEDEQANEDYDDGNHYEDTKILLLLYYFFFFGDFSCVRINDVINWIIIDGASPVALYFFGVEVSNTSRIVEEFNV